MKRRVPWTLCLAAVALPWTGGHGVAWSQAHADDCALTLSANEIEFGRFAREDLALKSQGQTAPLGRRSLTLRVNCRRPATIGLRLSGAFVVSSASTGSSERVRFGAGGAGYVKVLLSRAQADDRSVGQWRITNERGVVRRQGDDIEMGANETWVPMAPEGASLRASFLVATLVFLPFADMRDGHEAERVDLTSDMRFSIVQVPD